MTRTLFRLSAKFVQTVSKPGRHADGGGLYLATTGGGRRWVFLFRWQGKPTELGLGSAKRVTLAAAREEAAKCRDALTRGVNPKVERGAKVEPPATVKTFGDCADQLISNLSGSWRNPKHAAQWEMTLREYAAPLRPVPVCEVATEAVLAVLQPLWSTTPETASRLRGRIERVLSYAKAMGFRTGENPAAWRGHLDQILPKRQKLTRGHHKALPYIDVPTFMRRVGERDAVAGRALEFAILTAARSGEVLGAEWAEIDLERRLWAVPACRMKSKREHRVPLSEAAVRLLQRLKASRENVDTQLGRYVFSTPRHDGPLSNMSLAMMLRRLEVPVTVHGFRSSFRDWAAEDTSFTNEVCELALAHAIPSAAEAAYRRGDLFEKRRALMESWAEYCGGNCGEVRRAA